MVLPFSTPVRGTASDLIHVTRWRCHRCQRTVTAYLPMTGRSRTFTLVQHFKPAGLLWRLFLLPRLTCEGSGESVRTDTGR